MREDAAVTQAVQATIARFGRIDLLVNNAGVAPKVRADVLDAGEESFDRLFAINLKGPFFLSQLVAKQMLRQAPDAEGFRGRNYALAEAYHWRGLREEDDPSQTPVVAPLITYSHVGQPQDYGGYWSVDGKIGRAHV